MKTQDNGSLLGDLISEHRMLNLYLYSIYLAIACLLDCCFLISTASRSVPLSGHGPAPKDLLCTWEVHETKNVGDVCTSSVTFQFNRPRPGPEIQRKRGDSKNVNTPC